MIQARRLSALVSASALLIGLGLASSAQALTTWSQGGCSWAGSGNNKTCKIDGGANDLTIQAYSNTQGVTGSYPDGTAISGGKFETAELMSYSGGYGVKNRGVDGRDMNETGEPEHAIDNDGFTDGLLLSFTDSTILRSLTMGYTNTDADVSILAYVGTGDPNLGDHVLAGKTTAQLLSNGWKLVASNTSSSTGTRSFNSATDGSAISSSYWFVSAYNQGYAGSGAGANDHFKIHTFTSDPGPRKQVSEPGALALAGIGLLAVWQRRRKT